MRAASALRVWDYLGSALAYEEQRELLFLHQPDPLLRRELFRRLAHLAGREVETLVRALLARRGVTVPFCVSIRSAAPWPRCTP